MISYFDEMRKKGLVSTWLDDAIHQHPDKVQLRLADSLPYIFSEWEFPFYLKEIWRWN